MNRKISVVIMSCDAYADVWSPFTQAWDRFWPDCPYPCYLLSETKPFTHPRIQNLRTGKPTRWGEMIRFAIDNIETPYLLYMQEDYLLRSPVDQVKLMQYFRLFELLEAAYMRLLPWPGPDIPHLDHPEIGVLLPGTTYRTSLQASLWDKDVLRTLAMPSDDGRFESWSVERANAIDKPFLCLHRNGQSEDINHDGDYPLNYFATSVFQGKWLKEAVKLYRNMGIEINTSHRGVMNRVDFWEYHERKKGRNSIRYRIIKTLQYILDRFA